MPRRNLRAPTIVGLATLLAVYTANLPADGSVRSHKQKPVVIEDHPFSVTVSYSEKASKLLSNKSETVIVAAYFTGGPKKGAPRHWSDMGEVGLGESLVEITPGKLASFRQISFDADALAQINDQGPLLLINVFSGRKSSKDNLLDCDLYEGPLKAVEAKNIDISCHLITEHMDTKHVDDKH